MDDAWATFMDLERVGSCFPGATVTSVDESGFAGTVKVKLGPIALQYAGTGQFLERDDAAHRAVIEAKGKDKRGNGTAGATVTVQLAPSGEGTRIDVTTDLSITGKPAQFGRGVMQDVSDKLLQQFVQCIEGQFAAPSPSPRRRMPVPQLPLLPAGPAPPRRGSRPSPLPRRPGRRRRHGRCARHRRRPRTTRSTSAPRCCRCWSRATRRTPWRRSPGSCSAG